MTADLTIDGALKLLAKPKEPKPDTDDDTKDSDGKPVKSAVLGAVELPPNADFAGDENPVWLSELAVDELIISLREVHGQEYLVELHAALTKELTASQTVVAPRRSLSSNQ